MPAGFEIPTFPAGAPEPASARGAAIERLPVVSVTSLSAKRTSKRRRLRARVRNTGTQPVDVVLAASGLSDETDEPFSGGSQLTISPGTEGEIGLHVPDGFVLEASVAVIGQDPADSGSIYPADIFIDDEDLPGVPIKLVSGVVTGKLPLTWPDDRGDLHLPQRQIVIEDAGPAQSITLTLPGGFAGHLISLSATLTASVVMSTFIVRAIPPSAGVTHLLSVLDLPVLGTDTIVQLAPDLPSLSASGFITSPISGAEGVSVTSIVVERQTGDPYAELSGVSAVFRVFSA